MELNFRTWRSSTGTVNIYLPARLSLVPQTRGFLQIRYPSWLVLNTLLLAKPRPSECDSAGGFATSEWLIKNLAGYIADRWQAGDAATAVVTEAFSQVSRPAFEESTAATTLVLQFVSLLSIQTWTLYEWALCSASDVGGASRLAYSVAFRDRSSRIHH